MCVCYCVCVCVLASACKKKRIPNMKPWKWPTGLVRSSSLPSSSPPSSSRQRGYKQSEIVNAQVAAVQRIDFGDGSPDEAVMRAKRLTSRLDVPFSKERFPKPDAHTLAPVGRIRQHTWRAERHDPDLNPDIRPVSYDTFLEMDIELKACHQLIAVMQREAESSREECTALQHSVERLTRQLETTHDELRRRGDDLQTASILLPLFMARTRRAQQHEQQQREGGDKRSPISVIGKPVENALHEGANHHANHEGANHLICEDVACKPQEGTGYSSPPPRQRVSGEAVSSIVGRFESGELVLAACSLQGGPLSPTSTACGRGEPVRRHVSDATVSDATVSDATVSDATVSDTTVSDATVSDATVSDATVSDAVTDPRAQAAVWLSGEIARCDSPDPPSGSPSQIRPWASLTPTPWTLPWAGGQGRSAVDGDANANPIITPTARVVVGVCGAPREQSAGGRGSGAAISHSRPITFPGGMSRDMTQEATGKADSLSPSEWVSRSARSTGTPPTTQPPLSRQPADSHSPPSLDLEGSRRMRTTTSEDPTWPPSAPSPLKPCGSRRPSHFTSQDEHAHSPAALPPSPAPVNVPHFNFPHFDLPHLNVSSLLCGVPRVTKLPWWQPPWQQPPPWQQHQQPWPQHQPWEQVERGWAAVAAAAAAAAKPRPPPPPEPDSYRYSHIPGPTTITTTQLPEEDAALYAMLYARLSPEHAHVREHVHEGGDRGGDRPAGGDRTSMPAKRACSVSFSTATDEIVGDHDAQSYSDDDAQLSYSDAEDDDEAQAAADP